MSPGLGHSVALLIRYIHKAITTHAQRSYGQMEPQPQMNLDLNFEYGMLVFENRTLSARMEGELEVITHAIS